MKENLRRRRYVKTTLEDLKAAQVSLEKELNGVQEKRTNALLKLAKGDRNIRQLLDGFDTMEREVEAEPGGPQVVARRG